MARNPNSYSYNNALDEDADQRPQEKLDHELEEDLVHDLERTGHVLSYVKDISGEESARQLFGVMQDSRNMTGVRLMRGDPAAYQEDTHEQYIKCIMDIPATLDAKMAMSPEGWDDRQLGEAVEHEVNRMGYRLNLEIQDRFMNQFDHRAGIVRFAQDRGVSGELLELIDLAGEGKEFWVRGQRTAESPVQSKIEAAANFYMVEIGLVSALEERNDDAVTDFVDQVGNAQDLRNRAERAMSYVPEEDREMIREALEIAAHWTDAQIEDGAQDHHARYAELEYIFSNEARLRWLALTGEQREERTGDCAARAINEATGGQDYGGIWEEITASARIEFPEKDADIGVSNLHFRETCEQHGMKLLIPRSVEINHLMRKHLDLREIPALLEPLQEEGTPLTYIACSEGHAVAVVDGVLHDTWDSRTMGDPEKHWKDGKLVELWVKTDDEKFVEKALEILRKYETVRQYDDVLTYGRRRRETIPTPLPRELIES